VVAVIESLLALSAVFVMAVSGVVATRAPKSLVRVRNR